MNYKMPMKPMTNKEMTKMMGTAKPSKKAKKAAKKMTKKSIRRK